MIVIPSACVGVAIIDLALAKCKYRAYHVLFLLKTHTRLLTYALMLHFNDVTNHNCELNFR